MLTYKWTESDNVAKSDDTGGVWDAEIKREADTRVAQEQDPDRSHGNGHQNLGMYTAAFAQEIFGELMRNTESDEEIGNLAVYGKSETRRKFFNFFYSSTNRLRIVPRRSEDPCRCECCTTTRRVRRTRG